jgi:hypothetical protein
MSRKFMIALLAVAFVPALSAFGPAADALEVKGPQIHTPTATVSKGVSSHDSWQAGTIKSPGTGSGNGQQHQIPSNGNPPNYGATMAHQNGGHVTHGN